MVDPVTIIAIVNGSLALVIKCGEVAKILNNVASKFKKAELSIKLFVQQIDTIQAAWERIAEWSESRKRRPDTTVRDSALWERLDRSLECGDLVISALENDLKMYEFDQGNLSFIQRSKVVWNESSIQNHQTRVRDQVTIMTLLLQVLNLPSAQEQKTLLQQSEAELQRCEESVYSIVPSRLSRASILSDESAALSYHQLSFDDDLFAARVYKRKYPNRPHQSITPRNVEAGFDPSISPPTRDNMKSPRVVALAGSGSALSPEEMRELYRQETTQNLTHLDTERHVDASDSLFAEDYSNMQNSMLSVDLGPVLVLGTSLEQRQRDVVQLSSGALLETYDEGDLAKMKSLLAVQAKMSSDPTLATSGSLTLRAAADRRVDFMKVLLEHGANANHRDPEHAMAPLHIAASNAHEMMVDILVKHGSQINLPSKEGETPLHLAATACSVNVAELLISQGANVNAIAKNGYTPLHCASSRKRGHRLIALLVMNGADIEAQSLITWNFGKVRYTNPLAQAITNICVRNVKQLLKLGAGPNACLRNSSRLIGYPRPTPLNGVNMRRMGLFLENDANSDGPDEVFARPLHAIGLALLRRGNSTAASLQVLAAVMLKHGADIEAVDDEGNDLLHLLAEYAGPEMNHEFEILINFLLRKGARVKARNRKGRTAQDLAWKNERIQLHDILVDWQIGDAT